MDRLKLIEPDRVEDKLYEFKRLLERNYTVRLVGKRSLMPGILYSTEPSLESDKLGVVLKAILYDKYYAPIIVARGYGGKLYILDGHHRARVYLWLRELVDAYLLEALSYKPRVEVPLASIPIVNPPVNPPEPIATLKHTVNIIHFLEKRHKRIARVWRERVPFSKLYPTQIAGFRIAPLSIEEIPPPLIYRLSSDEYYIIDGHSRICSMLLVGKHFVDAIVFTLKKEIGIVEISRKLRLPIISREFCLSSRIDVGKQHR